MIHSYKDFHSFLPFFSVTDTQSYLKNCYQKLSIEQAEQKSYENSYPFVYYLEHAQIYYQQAAQSPLLIQPILLFYGFAHLIKACILTKDPHYPGNTAMLAHGVSTRKRKKQQYEFFHDEVKFQKNGLLSCMLGDMFNIKHTEGDKVTMCELFQQIPELHSLFVQLEGKHTFINVPIQEDCFAFSKKILDSFHMTENRFIDFLQAESSNSLLFKESLSDCLLFDYHDTNICLTPLKYHIEDRDFYFSLLRGRFFSYPEMLTHYLLLYNLSMIARYETEWWSELLKTMPNKDYPFIVNFLKLTAKKGPFLIYQFLFNRLC
ncbi:YaaC family protein [Bacillus tuaregi]|uniref:YaaC family protein n=1 Tax=Bacillus tuaregi TaxID=1816695 RepID=UPI0008F8B07B|nr:YaaC family protein [Bacillus tuaregi]